MTTKPELQKKVVTVKLSGRSTGMGAYTRHRIFSLRQRRELKPHRTESSRTGNHWTDFWYLLPGRYFVVVKDISNSGKHYCYAGYLEVSEHKYEIKQRCSVDEVPEFAREALCWCLTEPKEPGW